jgi:hypothetical protein
MLGSQGFAQVSVDVSQRSFQERSPYPQTQAWTPPADAESDSAATAAAGVVARTRSSSLGGVDAYA